MTDMETQIIAWIEKIGGGVTEREIAFKSGLPLETVEAACMAMHERGDIASYAWTTTEAARAIEDVARTDIGHPLDADSQVAAVTPTVHSNDAGVQPHLPRRAASRQDIRRGRVVA